MATYPTNFTDQEFDDDSTIDGKIETFRGVSVVQIPSPQNQKKTESSVNIPDFQHITDFVPKKVEPLRVNGSKFLTEKDRTSKIKSLQRSFPRVKSDRLKLLRNRLRNKTGEKGKNRTTKFKDKKEKDKAIKFILETIRKQRQHLKSGRGFKKLTDSKRVSSDTSIARSTDASTDVNEERTTTQSNIDEPDEVTYFPVKGPAVTTERLRQEETFPVKAETTERVRQEENTYYPVVSSSTTTASNPFKLSTIVSAPPIHVLTPTEDTRSTLITTTSPVLSQTNSNTENILDFGITTLSSLFGTKKSEKDKSVSFENNKSSVKLEVATNRPDQEDSIATTIANAVTDNSNIINLISFNELKSATPGSASSTSKNDFSEPLEIIRSSVIVSQNRIKSSSSRANRIFPQKLTGNSIVRSPKTSSDDDKLSSTTEYNLNYDEGITTTLGTVDLLR